MASTCGHSSLPRNRNIWITMFSHVWILHAGQMDIPGNGSWAWPSCRLCFSYWESPLRLWYAGYLDSRRPRIGIGTASQRSTTSAIWCQTSYLLHVLLPKHCCLVPKASTAASITLLAALLAGLCLDEVQNVCSPCQSLPSAHLCISFRPFR